MWSAKSSFVAYRSIKLIQLIMHFMIPKTWLLKFWTETSAFVYFWSFIWKVWFECDFLNLVNLKNIFLIQCTIFVIWINLKKNIAETCIDTLLHRYSFPFTTETFKVNCVANVGPPGWKWVWHPWSTVITNDEAWSVWEAICYDDKNSPPPRDQQLKQTVTGVRLSLMNLIALFLQRLV